MKKISLFIFGLLLCLITNNVYASNANVSVYANKSLVLVGDTVTVTVKLSSNSNLGSWNFDVVPSSNLQFISSSFGGLYVAEPASNANTKSKSYTFKFKAKSSGTGYVNVKNVRILDMQTEQNMSVTTGKTSFRMMTRGELEATYSKNNNLSSLAIEGLDAIKFDKDVLEYNIDLEYGTKEINILTSVEDKTASVSGNGKIPLSQGLNTIKIVVTAQNGSTKTYTINATVKELDPINIKVNGMDYTIIREKDFLPKTNMYFTDKVIMIEDKEVPAYYNEALDFTLVGLKDIEGKSQLFLYKDDKYELYNDFNFNSMIVYFIDMDNNVLPKGYNATTINIGETPITAYVNPDYEYPLLYGINIETGAKNLYKYDSKENTLQRYETIKTDSKLYLNMMIGMTGFIIISYIGFIYSATKKKTVSLLDDGMNIAEISADPINEVLNIKTKKEMKRAKKLAKKNAKKRKKIDDDNEKMASL